MSAPLQPPAGPSAPARSSVLAALAALAAAPPALASDLRVGATGAYDLAFDSVWSGAEVALVPGPSLVSPVGRLAGGWAFGEGPLTLAEAGLMVRIPEDEATLRAGVIGRAYGVSTATRLPVQFGDPRDGAKPGLIPAILFAAELAWSAPQDGTAPTPGPQDGAAAPPAPKRRDAFAVGFRGGPASTSSDAFCPGEDPDASTCITWFSGFSGGFYMRGAARNGLSAELHLGTATSLVLGYTFR